MAEVNPPGGNKLAIAVHGGAGEKRPDKSHLHVIDKAVTRGYSLLEKGEPAVAAVESAITLLEDSGLFNAGRGSRTQLDGVARMDAALMEGESLRAGAVAGVVGIRNPIHAARLVMLHTPHVLLAGEKAVQFVRSMAARTPSADSPDARTDLEDLYQQIYGEDTVGCVALDASGHVAAGASTGGAIPMLPGRVGDTPLIGSGLYADDEVGAVTVTGTGETICQIVLSKSICSYLENGLPIEQAVCAGLERMRGRVGGIAGAIALTRSGVIAVAHHGYMAAGYRSDRQPAVTSDTFLQVP